MDILNRIRDWARAEPPELATDRTGEDVNLQLRDAAVALLLEAAYGDSALDEEERKALLGGIEREFGVSTIEAATFMDSALGARPPLRKLHELTEQVKGGYDDEQKLELLALLWTVVRADERITEWERVFADHVAAAVGLTPAEWKQAKSRAESA
jgi:uncharacterized tellurite resistance protein B-like protein